METNFKTRLLASQPFSKKKKKEKKQSKNTNSKSFLINLGFWVGFSQILNLGIYVYRDEGGTGIIPDSYHCESGGETISKSLEGSWKRGRAGQTRGHQLAGAMRKT